MDKDTKRCAGCGEEWPCSDSKRADIRPDLRARHFVAMAADPLTVLRAIEAELDRQIYSQQIEYDFDAPDDAEYNVNISAKLWRRIGAITKNHQSGAI